MSVESEITPTDDYTSKSTEFIIPPLIPNSPPSPSNNNDEKASNHVKNDPNDLSTHFNQIDLNNQAQNESISNMVNFCFHLKA
jgi:hypothetical protein